ncbi:DUF4238 domain-containing protein (plasmid) [Paenibacillus rhizovicinus]|uniref:DUF4238 domain-containing protein n=1 Tax=Paenibacillus rhizovicinus TaxID=2704463 RepID=A0A6C0P9X6_9BACL|nr:DUF4238 domain-containing protein [Paenibacillus rhizovicinus]QHW35420.1 DUF4238 domain-containing protein [Paenibacillus rhizovicinus]
MGKTVKNQHYVPQIYLRHFTNNYNLIGVIESKTGNRFSCNIKNVAAERYFYDIDELDEQPMETILSRIEPLFATIFPKIKSRFMLSNPENVFETHDVLDSDSFTYAAFWLTLQLYRTKKMRNAFYDSFTALANWFITDFTEQVSPAELHVKLLHNHVLQDFELSKSMFTDYYWSVAVNQTEWPFVTSDTPVVRSQAFERSDKNVTWMAQQLNEGNISHNYGTVVTYPFDPMFSLLLWEKKHFHYMQRFDNRFLPADQITVVMMNKSQMDNCERHAFHRIQ